MTIHTDTNNIFSISFYFSTFNNVSFLELEGIIYWLERKIDIYVLID